jgi:hypothetical protein
MVYIIFVGIAVLCISLSRSVSKTRLCKISNRYLDTNVGSKGSSTYPRKRVVSFGSRRALKDQYEARKTMSQPNHEEY